MVSLPNEKALAWPATAVRIRIISKAGNRLFARMVILQYRGTYGGFQVKTRAERERFEFF
jgi:hypothetical protein